MKNNAGFIIPDNMGDYITLEGVDQMFSAHRTRRAPVYVDGTPIVTDKQMRPRDPNDFYETPEDAITGYLDGSNLDGLYRQRILDPGAGTGVWARVLRKITKECHITAVELQERFRAPEYTQWYDEWHTGDFLTTGLPGGYDVVIGNPPYKHAEEFFWRAVELTQPYGEIVFLLRLAFLASERRYDSMWTNGFNPSDVTVFNTRPSFTGDGKTYPTEFAIFRWKLVDGKVRENTTLNFMTYERGRTLQ